MHCPRCGRAATEYDANRWRCLFCDNKFIYEPPPAEVRRDVVSLDGLFICASCRQARGTGVEGALPCDACGKLTCRQCLTSDGWGNPVCRDCASSRHRQFLASPDARDGGPSSPFLTSFAWLGIAAATAAIPLTTFRLLGWHHLFWAVPLAVFAFIFLFSRTFSHGNSAAPPNPLLRFFGSLFRLAIVAGIPIFLASKLALLLGLWNLVWIAPAASLAILVLAAAAMEF